MQACLSQFLERFDQSSCNQLLNLFMTILPRSSSEAINEAFDKTMRTVVAGKAYRTSAERESGYKQLKRLFQWLRSGVEDAKRMSNKLNNASWVYDNLEKIHDNLKKNYPNEKELPNIDIRRLTLKQLYLVKNKSWCLLQEENSRERVRKPDDPLCDDQDFMELIRLTKGSNAY